jgi:hypothetical protein
MRDLRQSAETGAGPHTSIKPMYTQANARLPPASYQSVLKAREIPGFVIAPFAEEYETRTLNSFFDTLLSELKPEQAKERILSDVTAAGSIAMRVALDYVGNNDREFSEKFTFDKEFVSFFVRNLKANFLFRLLNSLIALYSTPHGTALFLPLSSPIVPNTSLHI